MGKQTKGLDLYNYAYQSIKTSLQRILNRPGFLAKMEHWRTRYSVTDRLSDVYDGNIILWKEFCSEKFDKYLMHKRNYGVMLNFDFFQPYKHTTDSYGAIYLTLMNLPRSERLKQENTMLVGIIPPFEHEPPSLNSFLKPLVKELNEFWCSGVRLHTYESPNYKLLFRLALLCVACDIPAARKCCGCTLQLVDVQDVENLFLVALVRKITVVLIAHHGPKELTNHIWKP